MPNQMKLIDADGHLDELPEEIIAHLDPPLKDEGIVGRTHGLFPSWQAMENRTRPLLRNGHMPYRMDPTPDKWLAFADQVGIERAVLYPTDALTFGLCEDPEIAPYLARAYNNWAHDRYMKYSDRLICTALIPMQNVPEAVKELRRAHQELGMPAVLPATQLPKPLGSRDYWPVFEEAERLDCFLGIHGAHLVRGRELLTGLGAAKILYQHPVGQMVEMGSMIFEGVFETFPKLKVGYLEAGCGWVPYFMDRMDEKWEPMRSRSPLRKKPSAYVRDCPIYISAEMYESALPLAVQVIGANHLFCASDFPHELDIPGYIAALDAWRNLDTIAEDDRRKILRDSAIAAYSLS
jgi:uncharacterized protein